MIVVNFVTTAPLRTIIRLMPKYLQQCFCLWWQSRHCLVKF